VTDINELYNLIQDPDGYWIAYDLCLQYDCAMVEFYTIYNGYKDSYLGSYLGWRNKSYTSIYSYAGKRSFVNGMFKSVY
jgi:hypothetical protein